MANKSGSGRYTFAADVDDMIKVNTARMTALLRQSTQEVIDIAQTPKKKGGKMPVDTGFLRASGQSSFTGMPTGPVRGDPDKTYDFDGADLTLNIAKQEVGSNFYFGWTAAYAKYREAYDGFLEGAAQRWPEIVNKVTEQIRQRIKK